MSKNINPVRRDNLWGAQVHMTNILAIDTSTDACSVALLRDGQYSELHEIAPRQHNQRLFSMLRELLPSGNLVDQGIDAIAYAQGPGSFTGLRIAASAVQGLAFANQLPAIAISTLACQAQTALRTNAVGVEDTVLSMLDARINEVYWALYTFRDELAALVQGPVVCAPQDIALNSAHASIKGVGGGFSYRDSLPEVITSALGGVTENIFPSARDLIPLALSEYKAGNLQAAEDVMPVYVREEVSWKKISEQGKRL